jgi:DDE superfamily endonuclease
VDSGYQGVKKLHQNSICPQKNYIRHPLSILDKTNNRLISSLRVINEHVIGMLKRFKIISEKYRNRRRRFGLRFNLIAGIYNMELEK